MEAHSTLRAFGYPQNVLKVYEDWVLLLRPEQTTIGSMVLVNKSRVLNYHEVSNDGYSELLQIVREVELTLKDMFDYDKLNYLMLMMKDPHVHYHIIPRYSRPVMFNNTEYIDCSWNQAPVLDEFNNCDEESFNMLLEVLRTKFETIKPNGKKYKVAYTTGVYDLFHSGHLNIIKKTKAIAEKLIVGVSTDELVKKEKNKTPFIPFHERIEIVESLKYVDMAIPQFDKNKNPIIEKYNIDVITVGSDWRGKYPKVNCDIVYFDYTQTTSSTQLQKLISLKLDAQDF
jgi:glycerol-3-phosphate cytidylyltransferase